MTRPSPVTVYWRPGCPYCARLRRHLRRLGVLTTELNIWEDPRAAAVVRSHADGNETVPTVLVGDTALVNPSAAQVVELARRLAPEALGPGAAAGPGGAPVALRVARAALALPARALRGRTRPT